MRKNGEFKVLVIFSLSIFHLLLASIAGDIITPGQPIADGDDQALVSAGGTFEFGFFSLGGSSGRYLGIWYKNLPVQTVVWVANREAPLPVSTGVLELSSDGDLALRNHTGGNAVWSSRTSNVSNPVLQLLDTGNLVVLAGKGSGDPKSMVWQSFDHPGDTMLPGVKLGWDLRRNFERQLTSWESRIDPSPGPYIYKLDPRGSPEDWIWSFSARKFRSGPWNGHGFSGHPEMTTNEIFRFNFVSNQDEVYYTYDVLNSSILSRVVLNQSGVLQRFVWFDEIHGWNLYWWVPKDQCDEYAQCGAHGVYNSDDSPVCRCLRGFEPKSLVEWNLRDGSDGCVRRRALDCPTGDGFLKVTEVKLPDTTNATVDKGMDFDQCRDWCSKNCSCLAFAFISGGSGCVTWAGDLVDIKEYTDGGQDLYVRLAASELDVGNKRRLWIIVTITTSLAFLIFLFLIYSLWRRKRKHKGIRQLFEEQTLFRLHTNLTSTLGESRERGSEFSLFHFSHVANATNNFSAENKLGEGGFGPVYKGQLLEGQEIAAKRLAACSGQGLEEFKNEILLIAKLQHRNLVRLLGCCIEGEEKILIYEYMPNKSLDFYLFDPAKGIQLDWQRRFHIIEGIAQGLLYLHKHSRLRIIHRDLKASNILLDGDMNPKISDFGMARIFGSDEAQTNTKRIVGTYGYMSPEYAMEGLFSIKSDVFSFGVLLLEIVSGKRNTSNQQYGNFVNLLGYAWELWREGRCLELMDLSLGNNFFTYETSRCIHVALMCVQESASDRPTMSDVITMLSSESATLPDPKQPAFFTMRSFIEEDSTASVPSVNNVTLTVVDGR